MNRKILRGIFGDLIGSPMDFMPQVAKEAGGPSAQKISKILIKHLNGVRIPLRRYKRMLCELTEAFDSRKGATR